MAAFFKSISEDGRDYHKEMNAKVKEGWTEEQFLPALDTLGKPALVVMDNASYHSRVVPGTAAPTSATRKDDMKEWLKARHIAFDDCLLKPELYSLKKQNKPEKRFVLDEMLAANGHLTLRLPPYHCNLNPIELIWGIMKNEVGQRNSTFKLTDMQNLASDVLEDISPEIVKNCFTHVDKIEKIYWLKHELYLVPSLNINSKFTLCPVGLP